MNANQAQIDQMVANLTKWKAAYYAGTPLVSDPVYDSVEDDLRKLDPNHAFLKTIGAPVSQGPTAGGWPKVKHTIPMSSLNKAQLFEDMQAWVTSCSAQSSLIVMDKLDGCSLSMHYLNRVLVQAVTRGDGSIGQEVTRNAMLMQGVVKMLPPFLPDGNPTPANVWVRGEVIIMHTDFARHFPGESNPRNSATGTLMRQTDFAKCSYLTFKSYNLMPQGVSMASKSTELLALEDMGFQTPKWSVWKALAEVQAEYQIYCASKRKAIGYEIDGLVVEIDDTVIREIHGDLGGRPKGSIAYKFPFEAKRTIIRDIQWQVGHSGRITPVAIFDEVILGGAKVTRASLAGVRQVEHLKLFPGCNVLVSKRNDVIPRLEANVDEGIVNDI